jgi:hypothetical protein
MLLDLFKPSRAKSPQALARRIAEKIAVAPVEPVPGPYIFIERLFPDDLYTEIQQHFALTAPLFKEKVHPTGERFFGSYADRLEIGLHDLRQLRSPLAAFWDEIFRALKSAPVFTAILEKFRPGFEARFGTDAATPALRDRIQRTLLLCHHRPGYHVGPHTDTPRKVLSCIINCAERDGLEHLGTAMYLPKQKGLTNKGTDHFDPALFERIRVVPFRPNSALIFFCEDALFHGVELLTEETLQGSNRPNIQYNLWDNNAIAQSAQAQ